MREVGPTVGRFITAVSIASSRRSCPSGGRSRMALVPPPPLNPRMLIRSLFIPEKTVPPDRLLTHEFVGLRCQCRLEPAANGVAHPAKRADLGNRVAFGHAEQVQTVERRKISFLDVIIAVIEL